MEVQEVQHERARLEDVVPRSAPFLIYLDPCGACNFRCNFCPCNISDFQQVERHKVMEWTLFEKIVEDLRAFKGQVKVINLFGYGEPLLHPKIADMVRLLKEGHCCREVRITTNGSLLSEEKSRSLVEAGVDLIRVSVEALSTDGYRDLCGVDVDFTKIVENIRTFYQISRGTRSKITAKIVSATLETKHDEDQFYKIFSPITDHHFIEDVEVYWAEFDEIQLPENQHITGIQKCYSTDKRKICSFPFTDMCIYSNGFVGACCADWKFATQYGDVRAEHLAHIWNGKKHLEFQRAHLEGKLTGYNSFCLACTRKPADNITDSAYMLKKLGSGIIDSR